MRGTPVWLCSISYRSPVRRGAIATPLWTPERMQDAWTLLRRMLGPAGDAARERIFRMQVTVCLHRACTPEEVAALPAYFHQAPPTDLAGGPVEILFETEDSGPSTHPCVAPRKHPLDPGNPLLWFPLDCGDCDPCRARRKLDADLDARTGAAPQFMDDLFKKAGV